MQTLRRVHTEVIDVDGHQLTAQTPLDDDATAIIDALKSRPKEIRLRIDYRDDSIKTRGRPVAGFRRRM